MVGRGAPIGPGRNTDNMVRAKALRALREAGLDRAVADESFDRFARLVHRQLGVLGAMVTLVLEDEQVHPGLFGLSTIERTRRSPLDTSLCRLVVETGRPLVLADVREHSQFSGRESFLGPVVAYVGYPLFDSHGNAVGSLCAIDDHRRDWTEDELAVMEDLALACSSELRLRIARATADRMRGTALQATRRTRLLLDLSEAFAGATSVAETVERLARVGARIGAEWSGLALLDPTGRRLRFTSLAHLEPGLSPALRGSRIDDERPSACVARTRTPIFFRNYGELADRFPDIAKSIGRQVGARAFVPVIGGSRLLGVMMLGWREERDFDTDAIETETAIATYLAHALERAEMLDDRNRAAATLQASLLSPLPAIRHLEVAFLYSPAARTDQVGGDWYDAVVLAEDSVVLTIGDVTGHDMHAAAEMGQLRSMLRAFVWSRDESPAALLRLLDLANDGLGLHATGTAIVARLDRRGGTEADSAGADSAGGAAAGYTLTWSNAGHPPPIIIRADGEVTECAENVDMMLGVVPDVARHDHRRVLAPGDTMLLYTDGLIERRDSRYHERLAALKVALKTLAGSATATLPAALVRRMVTGGQPDDVAVLAIRVRHSHSGAAGDQMIEARTPVAVEPGAIGPARRWVDDILESADVDAGHRRTAMLLTSEAVTNAVRHGGGPVAVEVKVTPATVRIEVSDGSSAPPRLLAPAPHQTGGRGVQFLDRRSARWGVRHLPDDAGDGSDGDGEGRRARKAVWFEVDRG